jgi:hypothetical protein
LILCTGKRRLALTHDDLPNMAQDDDDETGFETSSELRRDEGTASVGRDQIPPGYDRDASGLSVFLPGGRFARFLVAAGTFLALAGLASWAYPIVRAFTETVTDTDVEFRAMPWLPLGAILLLAGAVLTIAGILVGRRA